MQVADVRKMIDGLRWDRRRNPYSGRREYSQRAQAVAAAVADIIEAGDAASAGRLRDQLVDLLFDGGRGAEAVAVRREIYERRAIHQDYLKLRHAAQQAGQWAHLSGWALSLLRDRAHAERWYVRELISVLGSENLLDEAWAAAMANPDQVPESQWFQLIEVREKNHPADVIRPYQDLIEIGLERASDEYRYPKAVKAIRRLKDSYQRAGDEAGFTVYLADLRQRHRRKTSFIAKLDKALVRL